jgi:signal transduction histidine kinase/chemotaxis response regulator CheB
VGIGASAGGLEAFTEFLKAIPADTGLAFVYIQHLAPSRVSMLAEILGRATSMPVTQIDDQRQVEANHVYVVPPGKTAVLRAGKLHLRAAETHRAVDHFLTSLADERGPQSVGVILSGTATDGTLGLEAVKAAGGITFAQNSTAQHDGMPRSAVSSGCVNFVLAPPQIAHEIVGLAPHLASRDAESEEAPPPTDEFAQVLTVLRHETGVDFTQYKSNTLHRRIRRRMALHRFPTLAEYAQYLTATSKEVEALYQDILIGVTRFFRDPESFEMLKKRVFPALFKDRSRHDPVRLWVLGCATGEEAYSLAMAVKEYASSVNSQVPLIVYATDLNKLAIEKSRAALYPKAIAADVELALADEAKNDFLAMLAHELRNPLAPLRNAVQILNRAPVDARVNERTRQLIDRQVTNMVRMVDDLLDAARLTRGRVELQLETVVLQTVIQRAVDAARELAEERGHRVTVITPRTPVRVRGDSTRLEQVFTNLLHNAIKYTEKNGEISVTVIQSTDESKPMRREVTVRVRDNGIGIAPDMLPRVFDLFTQADHSIARTQGGLGIGLNIVRSLVELHGGQVSAHSAGLRLGSEFVVRLPLLEGDEESRDEETTTPSSEQRSSAPGEVNSASRFLVVDDSPDIAESTATLLGLRGYVVQTATSGEAALQAAEEFHPDFVLLDLGMPGLDGFAVARRMRSRQALRRAKLIAVSGDGSDADRRRAREAGFDLHFTKPLDLDALEALLRKR